MSKGNIPLEVKDHKFAENPNARRQLRRRLKSTRSNHFATVPGKRISNGELLSNDVLELYIMPGVLAVTQSLKKSTLPFGSTRHFLETLRLSTTNPRYSRVLKDVLKRLESKGLLALDEKPDGSFTVALDEKLYQASLTGKGKQNCRIYPDHIRSLLQPQRIRLYMILSAFAWKGKVSISWGYDAWADKIGTPDARPSKLAPRIQYWLEIIMDVTGGDLRLVKKDGKLTIVGTLFPAEQVPDIEDEQEEVAPKPKKRKAKNGAATAPKMEPPKIPDDDDDDEDDEEDQPPSGPPPDPDRDPDLDDRYVH